MTDLNQCETIKEDIKKSYHYWTFAEYIKFINPYNEFKSWEAGLSSTERKNKARVKKVLNALDTLNSNNLEEGGLFFQNLKMAIIEFMKSSGYEVKSTDKGYNIKKVRK